MKNSTAVRAPRVSTIIETITTFIKIIELLSAASAPLIRPMLCWSPKGPSLREGRRLPGGLGTSSNYGRWTQGLRGASMKLQSNIAYGKRTGKWSGIERVRSRSNNGPGNPLISDREYFIGTRSQSPNLISFLSCHDCPTVQPKLIQFRWFQPHRPPSLRVQNPVASLRRSFPQRKFL